MRFPQGGSGARAVGARYRGAAADDILDAAVLVRTARRILEGTASMLGDGSSDRHGIPMRVAI